MGYKGSSNVLEAEETFWDLVEDIIREADTQQVAIRKSIDLAASKWMVPHLHADDIEEQVSEFWNEIWGGYNE